MKTCGIFTIHEVVVKMKHGHEPWYLIPFGDIHRDSPQCAVDRWHEDLAEWKSIPNKLMLGMGDYTDMLSTSERMIIGHDGLHESTKEQIDQHARRGVKVLSDELKGVGGHWLGLLGGNHYYQFEDGTTGDNQLAGQLGTSFLGVCSFIRILFCWAGSTNRKAALTIFAHHGAGGGGRLVGGSMNRVAQSAEFADADICLMGHDHNVGILKLKPILGLSGNNQGELRVIERQRWVGRTGSYLKAYVDGKKSYNVDAARSPSSLGHIKFEITPTRFEGTTESGRRIDTRSIKIRGIS